MVKEEFKKYVEEFEGRYCISDGVYEECVKELSNVRLSQLSEDHEIRILRPFLLTWGTMGRVLGYQGVEVLRENLKDVGERIEPFRKEDLLSGDLDELRELVVQLFDEIRGMRFKSRRGEARKVGSTATSKILHLTCPDLFVMWDSAVRRGYRKFKGDGEDYFEFLKEMKALWIEQESIIKELQQRYGKRATKIIDQYNWTKTHQPEQV